MLFINFLCSLYLMVLIDSRTISKSINSYDKTDDVYDAITDLYYTTGKLKHNRHLHKHRRVDRYDVTRPVHPRIHARVPKYHGNPIYGRDTKMETKEMDKTYAMLTTIKVPEKIVEYAKHKSPKPRNGSFWRKFRNKLRKNKINEISRERSIQKNKDFKQNRYLYRKRKHNNEYERPKLAVKREASKTANTGVKKWLFDDQATTKMKSESRTPFASERNTDPTYVNLTAELDAITTQVVHLKELYAVDKYLTTTIEPPYFEYTEPRTSTVYETEFPGTAQIEELLNDIKAKAIQMIAEQSPSITEMISNTVTEATFDADPILAHTEAGAPGYAFSTFVSINEIDDTYNKRYADTTSPIDYKTENPSLVKNTEPHGIRRRSIQEDAMTMAQSVEDKLQKELKKFMVKAKDKISSEVQKGIHKMKDTKKIASRCKTTAMNPETKTPMTVTKKIYESTGYKKNRDHKHKKNKVQGTNTIGASTHVSTLDDYIMLTFYEKILSKSRDDNFIKMVTGSDLPQRIRKRDHNLLSKRNLETLTDLKLKEDIQKIYDDGVNMPEYDYSGGSTPPEDSTPKTETLGLKAKPSDDQLYDEPRTDAGLEETSYEALSNKIAYNDFVNGYRHYLKFQKDQANSNFSNMVRYQAHKHHNVDDIGKFILNKIPQLPNRINKRFFDDFDIEDQEVSTKSDDSWFKKHFYFFIDNGPPKKYHTSQTVSLKYPIKANKENSDADNDNDADEDGIFKTVPNEAEEATQLERNPEVNLEQLTRNLKGNKRQGTHKTPLLSPSTNHPIAADEKTNYKIFAPQKLIGKFFGGKKRQTLKPKHDINGNIKQINENGRLRRGADKSGNFNNIENDYFQLNDVTAALDSKYCTQKRGYVNINIVPQPTSIVKLRDSSTKSKIKNFFKKFRYHKKSKTPKKVQRHLKRRRRFSPMKKIKSLFSVKTDNRPMPPPNYNMEDYEMASSHVDGFKPIRYDRPMSVDEMKQQIPNITDVSDDILLKPGTTTAKTGKESADFKWDEDYFLNNQMSNFGVKAPSSHTTTNSVPAVKQTPQTKKRTTKKFTAKTTPQTTDAPMNVNIKTLKSTIELFQTFPTQGPLMTLEDMGNEIEHIQSRLFHYHKLRPMTLFHDVRIGHAFKKSTSLPNNRAKKSTVNPNSHGIHKIASKTALFPNKHASNHASKHPATSTSLTAKSFDEDLTLKGKRTRVANRDHFQLPNEFSEEYDSIDEPVMDYKKHRMGFVKLQPTFQPFVTVTVTQLDGPIKLTEATSTYKADVDYFSDLLLWNNDILNADEVPSPIWKRIIDAIDENSYTTPNLVRLASELNEINEYLNIAEGGRTTPRNYLIRNANGTQNIGIIKSLAINNKALAEGGEVIIEEEAKYLKFKKPGKVNKSNVKMTGSGDLGYKADSVNRANIIDNIRKKCQTRADGRRTDTTLLAYDDDIDFLYDMDPKKMSRNSLKSATELMKSNPENPVVGKTNQQPRQYYTTPLPMKSKEFERFLKQNSLDVESVTSPLSILPSYVDNWSHKTHTPEITSSSKTVGETMKDIKKIENVNPKLFAQEPITKNKVTRKIEADLNAKHIPEFNLDNNLVFTRFKRYNDVGASFNKPYRMDNLKEKKYYDRLKKKMKLFDNKYTREAADSTRSNAFNDLDLQTNKEVEITLINFDDINKTPLDDDSVYDFTWNKFKTTRSLPIISNPMFVGVTRPKQNKLSKLLTHNKLLYNNKNEKLDAPTVVAYSFDPTKPGISVDDHLNPTAFTESVFQANDIFNNLPHYKSIRAPNRVHISGRSYEYDIFYDQNKMRKNAFSDRNYIGKIERNIAVKTSTDATKSREPQIIFLPGLSDNSEVDDIRKKKEDKSFEKTNRKPREAVRNADEIPVSGSVVYDLKAFDSSTRGLPATGREKRLFKLLPLIQDKLKSLRTHTSTTVKAGTTSSAAEPTATEISTLAETTATEKSVKDRKSKGSHAAKRTKEIQGKEERDGDTNDEREEEPAYKSYEASEYATEDIESITPKLDKRDIQNQNTYTAKDVAALEIIVDLMKNTLNYEEKDVQNMFNKNDIQYTTKSERRNSDPMNSIQVHIAIPYDLQNSNKRSLEFDPVRVRKVFCAKMSTPVDLEYQVHSYENVAEPSATASLVFDSYPTTLSSSSSSSTEGLSPGMYLLVDKDLPNGYVLKPVTASISTMKDINTGNSVIDKVETATIKDGRITLSKDFMAAVNKQIIELFGNVTNVPIRQVRDTDNSEDTKSTKADENKKGSLWDAIKKIFGHDRVCSCKCTPYKAMCAACAASDKVMGELIFEFENLAKYMKEHCTEIQTFFWMNPTGGKKLRDAVHKIDTSMRDYFKRVKGKCQGRPCETFSTYLDKRDSKHHRVVKDVGATFLNDVETLAEDVNKITKVVTCFNQNLKDTSDRMIRAIGNFLDVKLYNKRSDINNSTKRKLIKNVYSLDNINVNIICKPEVSSSTENFDMGTYMSLESTLAPHHVINALEQSLKEIKRNNKKRKGLRKMFTRRNKLFSYYVVTEMPKLKEKRDVTQVEAPLISDGGGTFWYDYIKGKTNEPRNVRNTNNKLNPLVGVSVIERRTELTIDSPSSTNKMNNVFMTARATPKTLIERAVTTPPVSSYNINHLFKMLRNVGVAEIKNEAKPPKEINHNDTKAVTHKTKKPEKTKCTKVLKKIKEKCCNCTCKNSNCKKGKCTCSTSKGNCTSKGTTKTESPTTKSTENQPGHTLAMQTDPIPTFSPTTSVSTAKHTAKGILHKIIDKISKGNFLLDEDKLTTVRDKKRVSAYSENNELKTEYTTDQNPSIIFLDESVSHVDESNTFDEYKNLLLSIIQHETNKLNDEWMKFAYKNRRDNDKKKKKEKDTKLDESTEPAPSHANAEVDYDIINNLENMELPEPTQKTKPKKLLAKIANKMGIKMLAGVKKKAGKKRQLNILSRTAASTSPVTGDQDDVQPEEETDDPTPQICNIQATYDHIRRLHHKLPARNFERYVKNMTCYKYEKRTPFFFIKYPKTEKRWDWIRRKRSLKRDRGSYNHVKILTGVNDDEFETFVRGDDGIYRIRSRGKRTADLKELDVELRSVAPLIPAPNEIHAMLGDTITIDCTSFKPSIRRETAHADYTWESERQDMLRHDNIMVDGPKITIRDVGAKNDGGYTCSEGVRKLADIRVSVVTPPEYTVVFTPHYSTQSCGNQDLKAIELLGTEMSRGLSCGDYCSVRIDEPVCQKDLGGNGYRVKSTAVLSVRADRGVRCGARCARDLLASLALLAASTVPQLAQIGVLISSEGKNKTFLPSRSNQKTIVTHALSKKDSNGHTEYHGLASNLSPGDVDVVLACPGGFYLIKKQKICAACPANTSSSRGDNVCGARAAGPRPRPRPAARARHSPPLPRRYDWWWYPGCGYVVAGGGVLCACGVCAALALLGHVTSRAARPHPAASAQGEGGSASRKPSVVSACARSARAARAHPLSPSRVILARFYRPSLTSSRATDSQETKFELWKEINMPPPLPPIDFDMS